jgi:hypothetical protein
MDLRRGPKKKRKGAMAYRHHTATRSHAAKHAAAMRLKAALPSTGREIHQHHGLQRAPNPAFDKRPRRAP